MPDYYVSDIHLRLDRPERGERLARLVDRLSHEDGLVIVGDLYDFWFASRQIRKDPWQCEGLRSLRDFKGRGGELALMLGNHDAWLGGFFRETLGVEIVPEPYLRESHGLRIRAAHGHREKPEPAYWKSWLEGRGFLRAFGALPSPVAVGLEALLDHVNARGKSAADQLLCAQYRHVADGLAGSIDLAVFGHAHCEYDDATRPPRVVILGDWMDCPSYLRVDGRGARHFRGEAVLGDPAA